MNVEAAVFFGLCGGLAAEVLKWFRIREVLHRGIPDYAKKLPYWLATLSMIGIGGMFWSRPELSVPAYPNFCV